MSNIFLKKVNRLLESNRKMSLKVLLEEESDSKEEETDTEEDSSEDQFSDAFDDDSEDESTDEVEDDVDDVEEPEDMEKSAIDVLADLRDNLDNHKIIDNETTKIINQNQVKPQQSIKLVAASKIINYDSIENFVILEKEEKEEIQNMLNDFQDQIEDIEADSYKGLKTAQAGSLINVSAEADNAYHNFDNFDKLFKKSEIVYDWYVELIARTGPPDKREAMIKQFKDEYNKKLDPEDKIGIQEDPTTYNSMAGSKPTA